MNESLTLALAGTAGGGLGAIFFGGLWWTVRRGVSSSRPAVWFIASMFVRTGVTLSGIYLVSAGHWQRLVACLLGFIAARGVTAWATRAPMAVQGTPNSEAGHAP